jgi:hypothetical protein
VSRAFDAEVISKLRELGPDPTSRLPPINLSCGQGISFCPYCGKDLAKWIRKYERQFDDLARRIDEELSEFGPDAVYRPPT